MIHLDYIVAYLKSPCQIIMIREGEGMEYMTGRGIVNLIQKLREKGLEDKDILDIIVYIETHDPKGNESSN